MDMVGVSLLYSTEKDKKFSPFSFFFQRKFLFEAFACEIKTPFMKDMHSTAWNPINMGDGIVKTTCVNWHFVTP